MQSVLGPRKRTVATIGLPGHGKTVFLASLFWDSFFSLARSFEEGERHYTVRALSPRADEVFYANARLLHDLALPPANPRSLAPEPAVLEFTGIPSPRTGRRRGVQLTFYDVAGEIFHSDAALMEAGYLAQADDLLFLFDPTQPDFSALSAASLVDRVRRVAPRSERRQFILALSKLDELREQDEWIATLGEYWPEHLPSAGALPAYLREMEGLSARLREWWMFPERQAVNLIGSLPPTTRFCALSALGHQPVRDARGFLRLSRPVAPVRVRDPLFWVFRASGVL